ncbi:MULTISPECIES: sugar phosphate isomerase/epimerase family protein [Paenibacillus]|uniref:sugar phosphate isomerase/epimerase family protein n=1 Tax=Paenibacillus TaxID=44249 RepID=UPI0022B8F48D|nr:sugar phosphate isomerase/epimerase [Paenibacillus caseinilyticus]MCZ8522576.1 sugar phosphate isomerase/epimerase [Paenibacillus caseinilyticus]
MRRLGIGLQLYTLRNETAADFAGTLRKVAQLGYEGVEFAGFGGLSAEELSALLGEVGLKAIGAHVSLQSLEEDLQGQIDYIKAIGGQYVICPYVADERRATPEDWQKLFAFFEEVGAEVRKQGLTFAYHNHAFEFELNVGEEFVFDAMYSSTSPEAVQVEMDVCWVQFAGQDPLAYIPRYAGRLPLLHLKDFNKDEQGGMQTLELGQGAVDLKGVIAAASEAGVEWLIVEQDNCQNPPLQSVENSLEWVKANYLLNL